MLQTTSLKPKAQILEQKASHRSDFRDLDVLKKAGVWA